MTNDINYKISVMEAYRDGKTIEFCLGSKGDWITLPTDTASNWNWQTYNYRIKQATPDEIHGLKVVMNPLVPEGEIHVLPSDWADKGQFADFLENITVDNKCAMEAAWKAEAEAQTECEHQWQGWDGGPHKKGVICRACGKTEVRDV